MTSSSPSSPSPDLNELLRKFSNKTITPSELQLLRQRLEEKIESTEMGIAEVLMLGFVDAKLAMYDKQVVREKEDSEGETTK